MFAVLNINKPLGLTSHDVVSAIRRIFNLKKVGHAGTLDPMAEGVLPVCLGQSTRLIEYFATDKHYRLNVTLGITTHTLDQEGDETRQTPCPEITPEAVKQAFQSFIGTFEQKIPAHSAKRVDGKKLYKLAHQGINVETPSKTVTVYHIELIELKTDNPDFPVAILDVHCGSGTFMRAIARDIGEALGCGAHLSGLVRTYHGRFALDESITLDALKASDNPSQYLLNPLPYIDLPRIDLETPQQADRIRHGMKIQLPENESSLEVNAFYLLTRTQTEPVAIAQRVEQTLKPVKVFNGL